jgi:hypothetical protein
MGIIRVVLTLAFSAWAMIVALILMLVVRGVTSDEAIPRATRAAFAAFATVSASTFALLSLGASIAVLR